MRNKVELAFAVFLVPVDYAAIVLAGLFAYFVRFESFVTEFRLVGYLIPFQEYLQLTLVLALLWIPIFALAGLYRMRGTRRLVDEFTRTFFGCSTGILGIILFIFFRRELFASRFIVLAVWGFAILFVFLGRTIVLLLERVLFFRGVGVHRIVILGGDKTTEDLIREIRDRRSMGYLVVRHFNDFSPDVLREMDRVYREEGFDEIIQADPTFPRSATEEILAFAEDHHVVFKYIADIFATHARNIGMTTMAGIPIVEVRRTRLEGWGKILKRAFDIVVSFLLLVLLSPLFFLLTLLIKLDSRGPVFFSALDDGTPLQRIGGHGKPFLYFKFRSMKPGTHHLRYTKLADRNIRKGGPLVKIRHDPRITRVGRFLRRFSLDELPELFLVLKGDMSLVGPRPHLPEEVEKYTRHHKRVLTIKPGMTGLAQISGRSDLSFDEEVRLDTYYIENWSLGLDIYILIRTPIAVLGKRKTE